MATVGTETKLLARHSSVYALGTMLQRLSAILLLPIYTTYLSPTDYGVNELVGLAVNVIGILVATAIASAIFRFYFDYDDPRQRNAVMSTAVLTLGAVGLVALAVFLPLTGVLADLILDDVGLAHFFMIALGSLWFHTVNNVSFAWLRANQKSLQYVGVSLTSFVVTVGLNIYFIKWLQLGVLGILLSTLIVSVLLFLVLTVPLFLRIGLRFDRSILGAMWTFGWPGIFGQFGGFVVHVSDRLFLKAYCSIAETGIYSLGYRFGTLPSQFISEPFNQTWMPRRFEIAKEPGSEDIFGRIFTYYLCLISFAGLLVAGLTADILRLIADSRYWAAASVVPVIVLANIIFTFHYHFNIGLLLTKKTKQLAAINVLNAVFVLGLNWLLIPRYAIMGAAAATLIAFVAKAAMTFFLGRRYYRTRFEGWRAVKLLVVSAAVFLAAQRLHLDPPLLALAVKGVIITVAYPLLLVALRFFTSDERARARSLLHGRLGRRRRASG